MGNGFNRPVSKWFWMCTFLTDRLSKACNVTLNWCHVELIYCWGHVSVKFRPRFAAIDFFFSSINIFIRGCSGLCSMNFIHDFFPYQATLQVKLFCAGHPALGTRQGSFGCCLGRYLRAKKKKKSIHFEKVEKWVLGLLEELFLKTLVLRHAPWLWIVTDEMSVKYKLRKNCLKIISCTLVSFVVINCLYG